MWQQLFLHLYGSPYRVFSLFLDNHLFLKEKNKRHLHYQLKKIGWNDKKIFFSHNIPHYFVSIISPTEKYSVVKYKKEYFKFCESCIEELARFGNMKEKNGAFFFEEINPKLELFFHLSIKLLLTFLDINLRKYLEIEISREEIDFFKNVEVGHNLIEHARRVKKPMPKEEAIELATELEELVFFIETAKKKKLLIDIKDRKLSEYAKEQKVFLEEAQGETLATEYAQAKELIRIENGEKEQKDGGGLDYSNSKDNQGNIDESQVSDEVKKAKQKLRIIQNKIEDVFVAKNNKEKRLAILIEDSKKGEPYYYKYITKICT